MVHQTITILIVDDEASIRNGLSNVIPWEELNIKVLSTAQNGLEALELIEKYRPNIVLTDIRMPECDGLTLIQRVRELKIDTKFIIISGYDDFTYAQSAIRYGVKSYLLKPIKKSELMDLMHEVVAEILTEQQRTNETIFSDPNQLMENHALKEKFFTRLLQNEFRQESDLLKEMKPFHFNIQNDQLQAIVFNYELKNSENDSGTKKYDPHLLKTVIKNTIEEILFSTPNLTFEYTNNYVVAIINTPLLSNSNLKDSHAFCKKCIDSLMSQDSFEIYAGIGDMAQSLLYVSTSYCVALESLSYMLYETPQRIFDSSIICHTSKNNISANHMDNSALIDAIYRGNVEETLNFTTAFFNSFFTSSTPPPNLIRGMCIYLVMDVQKGLSVYLDEENGLLSEKPNLIINQLPFFNQIKEWIISLFLDYINYIRSSCKFNKDPIIEKAKAYINSNIFKKLKADEVAAHVNLSENYFTVYFKEKTHENFSNYIVNLKIEHAKNILKSSHKSISEISFLLGYEDYRSFNRVFKKITGKKPSEFRQLYENKK